MGQRFRNSKKGNGMKVEGNFGNMLFVSRVIKSCKTTDQLAVAIGWFRNIKSWYKESYGREEIAVIIGEIEEQGKKIRKFR